MNFLVVLEGVGIAAVILLPLAAKWQIRPKRSLAGAIIIGLLSSLITAIISGELGGLNTFAQAALEVILILGLATVSVAYMFYRDPERDVPAHDGAMVSPADGEVIYIKEIQQGKVPLSVKQGHHFKLEELTQTGLMQDGGYLIGIGMNLLNVHVNRAPIKGKVEMIKHVKGSFLSLRQPGAVLRNERVTTVIDEGRFKVAVVQIASRLVRRIDSYLYQGQAVEKGQRIGMIKFGSQVDLVIPKLRDCKIMVRPGDEVKAGTSVLVEYRNSI
jgi:phosphatidylserine decarboxylase